MDNKKVIKAAKKLKKYCYSRDFCADCQFGKLVLPWEWEIPKCRE